MTSPHLISRLSRTDWDFTGQYSESPFSAIHWHPGRYASQLPAVLIGLLSKPGEAVLDPFAGSGTTLIEAQRLGRRSLGVDVNPVSCLISRSKTLLLDAKAIQEAIRELKLEATTILSAQLSTYSEPRTDSFIPETVQAAKWYTKEVRRDLGALWGRVTRHRGARRILAEASFSAILLKVCRETRHWGYVCDNSSPKTNHSGDVLEEYCVILDRLADAYAERDAQLEARFGVGAAMENAEVLCGRAEIELANVLPGAFDLVVTSPPYYGVTDYVKAQRLSMEWMGLEIEPLRLGELGARSKRHRKTAEQEYLEGLRRVFELVSRCLRRGGRCAVVIGESGTRNAVVKSAADAMAVSGLTCEVNLNRRVSSQRRQAPSVTNEHILIFVR
jgi:DNA methylase